jgi:hypothetical protein
MPIGGECQGFACCSWYSGHVMKPEVMHLLLVTLLGQVLFVWSAIAETKTDREREGLIGAVHTVVTEMAQLTQQEGQWTEDPRVRVHTSVYDTKGNLREHTSHHPDGALAMKQVRTYEATSTLTKEVLYNPDDSLWRTAVYDYDADGNLSKVTHYVADGSLLFTDVYSYDAQGNLAEFFSFEANDTPLRKTFYTYGPQGKMTEKRVYDAHDTTPTATNTYTYDAAGNLTELATYGRSGALSSRWVYAYDDKGNQIQWIAYQPDGSISVKQTYTYEFDATGNWIKKTTSELITDGDTSSLEPSEVTHRTITYHTGEGEGR